MDGKSTSGEKDSGTHSQISVNLESVIINTRCPRLQFNNNNDTIVEEFFLKGEKSSWDLLGLVVYNEPTPNIDQGYNLTYSINVTGDYYLLLWITSEFTGGEKGLEVKVC